MFKQKWLNFLLVKPKLSVTSTRAVINTDQIVSVAATQFTDYSFLREEGAHKLMLVMKFTDGKGLSVILELPYVDVNNSGEDVTIQQDEAYNRFTEALKRETIPVSFLEWK